MTSIKKLDYRKEIIIVVSALLLLQSCNAYKTSSVSLEQAVQEGTKVKVTTKDDRTLKFKAIQSLEGQYYGVVSKDNASKNIRLIEEDLQTIRIHDKKRSTINTIILSITIVGGLFWIGYIGLGGQIIDSISF